MPLPAEGRMGEMVADGAHGHQPRVRPLFFRKGAHAHGRLADDLEHLHDVCLYGHLKYKGSPLWIAILVSWGIAFVEFCS